jgi:antitoxin (DNA-binding transcriptional repressor) of toxin-antitoxin stability system
MPIVTMHAAKTNPPRLIEQACAGEEIIIARGDQPVVKLVPVETPIIKREPGTLKGQCTVPPKFFEPLSKDELAEWD